MNNITKVTTTLDRVDGSQVKIVSQLFFGAGLKESIGVYVLRRDTTDHEWKLCSDTPAPNWRDMSVDEYIKHGRSELLQTVSIGEILKSNSMLGRPMDEN